MTTTLVLLRSVPAHRRLWLRGKLTEKRARALIASLRRLNRSSSKAILLLVNSPGGNLLWSEKVAKEIKNSPAPVYALVTKAYSSVLNIVQVCNRRFGRPKSLYNVHYNGLPFVVLERCLRPTPYMDTESFKRFLDDTIEPFLRSEWLNSFFRQILLTRVEEAGKTEEDLHKLMLQDLIIDAKQALEWGFIDEIVRRI